MMRRIAFVLVALVSIDCAHRTVTKQTASSGPAAAPRSLPFAFERNDGQAPGKFQFLARRSTFDMRFGAGGVSIALQDTASRTRPVTLQFAGSHGQPPVGDGALAGKMNYLRGTDPAKWQRDVPTYDRVRYSQIYDGVDAVFYGSDAHVEYDLLVAPHADPSRIKLAFAGADRLTLNAEGDLVAQVEGRALLHRKPVAFQRTGSVTTPVDAAYRLRDGVAEIELGAYDRAQPLVIDPVIKSSIFIQTAGNDYPAAVAVDASGYAYVAYRAYPTNNDERLTEVHVVKIDHDERHFVYDTVFGGSGLETVRGMAVDATGHVYVTGMTQSNDFPTTAGAYSRSCDRGVGCSSAGGGDIYVTKLTSAGNNFSYSTFVGGSQADESMGLAIDGAGQAYIAAISYSSDYPVTPGAAQQFVRGTGDTVVTKLSADGHSLLFSTYYGGHGVLDVPGGIALDAAGNAYITGTSNSNDLPMVAALQPANASTTYNHYDGFAAKFSPTGTLLFSTYLGGSGDDYAEGVAVDATGVYLAGFTTSANFPGAASSSSDYRGFVAQLATDGSQLLATRALVNSRLYDVAIDANRTVHVMGLALDGFPVTNDAVQLTAGPSSTPVAYATLPLDASHRLGLPNYATFFGASAGAWGAAIAVDGAGGAYLVGYTAPVGFPLINAAAPSVGQTEGFITHFVPDERFVDQSNSDDVVLWARNMTTVSGAWRLVDDPSAAGGRALVQPDAALAKVSTPAASPSSYSEIEFDAHAGGPYRLWVRGKAQKDSYNNDSVYVQLSDAVATPNGSPLWRIGTASAAIVILEDCTNCGVKSWGWQDITYGPGRPQDFYLATTGKHTIRFQNREDGLMIDQVVIGGGTYAANAPGVVKADTTVLPPTVKPPTPPPTDSCTVGEVVMYASAAEHHTGWEPAADASAAGGARMANPNAGAPKRSTVGTQNFELEFNADANTDYRLWIRGKAEGDSWANDSVFVQFTGAVDSGNAPIWQINSGSFTEVNLEDCSGCGLKGWGWQDNGWGVGVKGPVVRFSSSTTQTIKISTREDGLSIDQVVLSSGKYLNASPGSLKNDATILPACSPPLR